MRQSSTVSPPTSSCSGTTLSTPALRFVSVHFLNGQVLYFVVEPKSKTKELYNQTCTHLTSKGMLNTDIFGLAVYLEGEYVFVDPDYKLSKYAPKCWRSSSTHGLDNCGKPLLSFYFRVQFYVESPLLLQDDISRNYYYLQLRLNLINRGTLHEYVAQEVMYVLIGLALQADLGDYNENKHSGNYFHLQDYFPPQIIANGNETQLYEKSVEVHRSNRALCKEQAEAQFIREASCKKTFPLLYNSHLYRLKQKKSEPSPGSILMVVLTNGLELFEEKFSKPISETFYWNNIGKLCYERKKFEIRSTNRIGDRMVYYTSSDEKSKHLLILCRLTHQFSMSVLPKLVEVAKKEDEERKLMMNDWNKEFNGKLSQSCYPGHNLDQRISVISNTSSNTTSGIVSDRVHSLDESEDDLEMEIIINSPPAVSVESLALAHLRDVSSTCSSPTRKLGKPNDVDKVSCSSKSLLPPTTPGPADGSQCSSSCSTVVVNLVNRGKNAVRETTSSAMVRRHSTSSSLELGFSHTAQNSAFSDSGSCLEIDYQSAQTSSGIYTLQSSCETNTVATATAACSSETSGICHSTIEDYEGHRSRSGSVVSTAGSFHGDGSDPSDTGHGTPLTAEELSNLIVGRSPKPCRGKYPSAATVSETLDSVSDYVTLPPPPIPPMCHNRNTKMPDNIPSRYKSEENILQRQIQFQHLAGLYSSHVIMDALPGQSLGARPSYSKENIYQKAKEDKEQANARLVKSNPQLLKAHSSVIPCNANYASSYYPPNKHNCTNSVPVVGSNNYLDVRGSGAVFLQQIHDKYPPPPPPPRRYVTPCMAQHEQYRQQLYSDVDYVIYPMRDPAISKQEYLDSRIALGHCGQYFPPTYHPLCSARSHLMCRSTPNVAALNSHCYPCINPCSAFRYASNQNLSSDYYPYPNSYAPASNSPLYSPNASSYSSSSQSLKSAMYMPSMFTRTLSDERVPMIHTVEKQPNPLFNKVQRPPPPPPYEPKGYPMRERIQKPTTVTDAKTTNGTITNSALDITSLREKSRNLDLPLISALCNDRSLLRQTNTSTTGKKARPFTWYPEQTPREPLLSQSNSDSSIKKILQSFKHAPTSRTIDFNKPVPSKSSISLASPVKSISKQISNSAVSAVYSGKLKYSISPAGTKGTCSRNNKSNDNSTAVGEKQKSAQNSSFINGNLP